jgi:hypothetical protein
MCMRIVARQLRASGIARTGPQSNDDDKATTVITLRSIVPVGASAGLGDTLTNDTYRSPRRTQREHWSEPRIDGLGAGKPWHALTMILRCTRDNAFLHARAGECQRSWDRKTRYPRTVP